jgi:ribonuclease Z
MPSEISDLTELACEGSTQPLTTTPVAGTPDREYPTVVTHHSEPVATGEMRVTILGSGDPFVKQGQASASVLVELGNDQQDTFFLDLGSGSLANFTSLQLPVTSTTKVFLSHLHADHVGDMPTLLWSLAKSGRRDPVEAWGPAGEYGPLGTRSYMQHIEAAHAWDMESMCGHPGQSGATSVTTEVPFDRTATVYERNGLTVTSFPVIHILNGAVGYRIDYAGRSVVFSGDTRPCHPLVDACDGADLLIHETFPSPAVFAKKAGVPENLAELIVNGSHTSPTMAGKVFSLAQARMSAMWHFAADHETVGPAFREMRSGYDGPVVIAQDLTTFLVTKYAVVARQASFDPMAWPVVGQTNVTGPPMSSPHAPPAWWSEALIAD